MKPITILLPLALAAAAGPALGQEFNGILVLERNRTPVAKVKVFLSSNKGEVLDSAVTDPFGGFLLRAPKDGRYMVIIRRAGFLPISSDPIELNSLTAVTDTITLDAQAERPVKEVIAASMRRSVGSSVSTSFWRYMSPDDIEKVRSRFGSLADLIRVSGRFPSLLQNAPPTGCFYFTGQIACAQLYLNGVAVVLPPDQLSMREIEAVVAVRPDELGAAIAQNRFGDNTQFGAIFVFTSAFLPKR